MNIIWEYKGREYPFDVTEEYCYSLVTRGLCELKTELEQAEAKRGTVFARVCCDVISGFFDTVFGVGAGKRICGEKNSAAEHISAYMSFISFLCSQVDDFSRIREALEAHV